MEIQTVTTQPPGPSESVGGAEICPLPGDYLGPAMLEIHQPRDFPSLLPLLTLANRSSKMLTCSGPRPWHQPHLCAQSSIVPKVETGQNRHTLVTNEKSEVQRDKVTCPRSHSWSRVEAGPGVLILLSWSQTSEESQGPKQVPAASCLGPERGWQDSLLCTV